MAHIHSAPGQHDLTVSAFIIRMDGDVPKAMLHLHKKLGVYMQFGGHVELHENPWQAITHEIKEESGYELSELELLQPQNRVQPSEDSVFHPQPIAVNTHEFVDIKHFHSDIAFAFVAAKPPVGKPAEDESQDFVLFTEAELAELPADKVPGNVRQTFLFAMQECLQNWERIPAETVA